MRTAAVGTMPAFDDIERAWEGVVYKRKASRWRAGERSPDWRKRKVWRTDDFVVTAYRETCGMLDAVFIARDNDGTLDRCCTVEGFSRGGSPRLLHELLERAAGAPSRHGWRSVPPILHVSVQHRLGPSGDVREPLLVGIKPG